VAVIPHLLHDEMVSEAQKRACRAALYPSLSRTARVGFPVAPLSIAERVVDRLLALNPALRILMLGGDHSVTWPIVAGLGRHRNQPWAIVHPDAHTDLLPERLGVKYCFATWAFHANEVLGRGGRLVQVGIRTMNAAQRKQAERFHVDVIDMDRWVAGDRPSLANPVYLSIDLDGLDPAHVPGVAHPEPGGLTVREVVTLIHGLNVPLVGADVVELNPELDQRGLTAIVAAKLVKELAGRMVGESRV